MAKIMIQILDFPCMVLFVDITHKQSINPNSKQSINTNNYMAKIGNLSASQVILANVHTKSKLQIQLNAFALDCTKKQQRVNQWQRTHGYLSLGTLGYFLVDCGF